MAGIELERSGEEHKDEPEDILVDDNVVDNEDVTDINENNEVENIVVDDNEGIIEDEKEDIEGDNVEEDDKRKV